MCKKISMSLFSAFLAVLMIFSSSVVFADTETVMPETDVLVSWANESADGTTFSDAAAAGLSSKAYNGGKSSLVIKRGDNTSEFADAKIAKTFNELKDYGYENRKNAVIKIRFYSESVGSCFKVIFGKKDMTASNSRSADFYVNGYGWQEYSVPFVNYISGTDTKGYEYVRIDVSDLKKGDKIYIDSIWFQRVPQSGTASDVTDSDAVKVIDALESKTLNNNAEAISDVTTNLRPNGAKSYTMVNIKGEYPNFQWYLKKDSQLVTAEKGSFGYFNMWMYSPRPQSGGLMLVLNGSGAYTYAAPTVIDWSGWKLISVPISKDTEITNISLTAGNYQGIGTFSYNYETNAFNTGDNTKRIFTNKQNTWQCEGQFGIETMWLSSEKPTNADTIIKTEDDEYSEYATLGTAADDMLLFDANSFTAQNNLSADTGMTHIYGKSARGINLGRIYAAYDKTNSVWTVSNTGGATDKNTLWSSDEALIIKDVYDYINLWVYSPGVKKDQFGNYSEYILKMEDASSAAIFIGIPAKWTGWKLISIPISEFSGTNADRINNGIKKMFITANQHCATWNAITDSSKFIPGDQGGGVCYSRDVGDKDYDFGINAYGRFNTFGDVTNYVGIERVWLSKDKPNSELSVSDAEGQIRENLSTDITEYSFTASNKIGLLGSRAYNGGNTASVTYDKLDLGESVNVKIPRITDIYGNVYSGEDIIRLKAENQTVSYDSEMNTVTVKVSDELAKNHADMKLFAVSYSENEETKELNTALTADLSDNILTIDVSSFSLGSNMNIMLWDMSNLYPVMIPKTITR